MNKEAYRRFLARRNRITGDLLAGIIVGYGLGWMSFAFFGADFHPSTMTTVGVATICIGAAAKSFFDPDFWRGQLGRPD